MNRVVCALVRVSIFATIAQSCLVASIDFGSQDAIVQIMPGARLHVGTTGMAITGGTLKKDDGANITGNDISMNDAVLDSAGLHSVINGTFDPTDGDSINLTGNSSLSADSGTCIEALNVSGASNALSGTPLFNQAITLANSGAELALNLQSSLNQNIVLNNGTLTLANDLRLNDDVSITGSGIIQSNGCLLELGDNYSTPWTNNLTFSSSSNVALRGDIKLDGQWTFFGNSSLNGNGANLDLSDGGKLIVGTDGELALNNIYISGISGADAASSIVMNNRAQIRTDNTTLKITTDVTTNNGTLYVAGPTTLQLGSKDWTFNNNANITVDGTSLWLDYLDSVENPGTILAPQALFDGHIFSHTNLVTDLASGNLSLINRGTIKEATDSFSAGYLPTTITLLKPSLNTSVTLDQSVVLTPHNAITITDNITIDGQGASLEFSNVANPQFTVAAGKTVTLKNITLKNITANTFNINGTIIIDKNVVWELTDDIIWKKGIISIVDNSVNQNGTVFTMRSSSYRRLFTIDLINPFADFTQTTPAKALLLGHNTLVLSNVQFSGTDYVSFVNSAGLTAVIAVINHGSIIADSNFPRSNGDLGTNISFLVEGPANNLIIGKDGFVLDGTIIFSDAGINELNIKFDTTLPLDTTQAFHTDVNNEFYVLQLQGDTGILVDSANGVGQLNFIDNGVCVRNNNSNAFATGANAFVSYNNLQVLDFPIKQTAVNARFVGTSLLGLGADPSFIRSPAMLRSGKTIVTAFHKAKARIEEVHKQAKATFIAQQKQKIAAARLAIAQEERDKKQKILAENAKALALAKAQAQAKIQAQKLQNQAKANAKTRVIEEDTEKYGTSTVELTAIDGVELRDITLPLDENEEVALTQLESYTREFITQLEEEEKINLVTRALTGIPADADITTVYFNTGANLSAPLTSNVRVENSNIRGFQIDTTPFNLILDSNAVITQAIDSNFSPIPLVLTTGQALFIRGDIVTIHVTGDMTIGNDTLFFRGHQKCVFALEDNATVTIADNTILNLEDNTNLVFTGNGKVILGTNVTINGGAKKENRSRIQVTGGAQLTTTLNANVTFLRFLELNATALGTLLFNQPCIIQVGPEIATVVIPGKPNPVPDDQLHDMRFMVNNNGSLVIGSPAGTDDSIVTTSYATVDLQITFGSLLKIYSNGLFNINTVEFTPAGDINIIKSGLLKNMRIIRSTIDNEGSMIFGTNRFDTKTAKPIPFSYQAETIDIEGDGSISYADYKNGFQPSNVVPFPKALVPTITDIQNFVFNGQIGLLV